MGECVYGRVCGQAACNHSDATTCWTNLKVVPGKTTDCSKARSFLPNILSILLWAYLCLQRSSGGNWWGANLRIIVQGLNCSHPLSWLPNCRSHSLSHVRRRQEWCNEADFNLMLPWLSLKQIFIPPFIWEENKKWISFTYPSLVQSWPSVLSVFAVLIILSISINVVLGS